MNEYVLRGGDQGARRLRILARVKWPTTRALLRRVGLRKGMRCLDVGCGSGQVTLRLARWVGPQGKAVGIDVDARALELAQAEARRRQLSAEFRLCAATELDEEASYDLVVARFLLAHLSDPGQALARMVRAVRPGGLVVVEDIDFPGHFCYPLCPAFARYVSLFQEVVRRKGGDAALGPRLLELFAAAGVQGIDLEVVLPTFFEGEGKRIAQITLEHIAESVMSAGLATAEEIARLVAELDTYARAPGTLESLPRIFQVWGRRAVDG